MRIYRQKINRSLVVHMSSGKLIRKSSDCNILSADRRRCELHFVEIFFGVFDSFFFGSFFLGKVPSNMHSNPLCEPHPSISLMVTDDDVKLKCKTHGSPEEWYAAVFAEVKLASPFNSPVQFFFSK